MRCKIFILLSFAFISFVGCTRADEESRRRIDELNGRAYSLRYTDVDSTLALSKRALSMSASYSDGMAEAWNNIAFVAYQQMRYTQAKHLLGHVYGRTHNQIELLCADVTTMKVAQRIGDGKLFFDKRLQAQKRIRRIKESETELTDVQRRRFFYGETEMRIVSSTYYYYLGQDSSAISEIRQAGADMTLERDTLQWLYYNYMIGSGGLLGSDNMETRLVEFDHLIRTYTLSHAKHITYFEANALQSIASFLSDSANVRLIATSRPDVYDYLYSHSMKWRSPLVQDSLYAMPYAMARQSEALFRQYKDLYQTANATRTLGEILFACGKYADALRTFRKALYLVHSQEHRDIHDVASWKILLYERLSKTYSALDMSDESDIHRNAYLDLLDSSRQNREVDSRMDELSHEISNVHAKLYGMLLLVVVVFTLAILYSVHIKKNTYFYYKNVENIRRSPYFTHAAEALSNLSDAIEEKEGVSHERCSMLRMKTDEGSRGNLERRAKLTLAYSIVPYIDRMLSELRRMKDNGVLEDDRVEYLNELTHEVMRINDSLTDWIQMQRGRVKSHISSFPLQAVFNIIALGYQPFRQKGVCLDVRHTDVVVKADQPLTLFMTNTLADNARKFTPEGGTVVVDASATESYVEISVSDTGIGLTEEDVRMLNDSKVYDPSRLSGQGNGRGFGFGIMNCRGIINNYRKQSSYFSVCDFGVESLLGKGSRFWFRLPRVLVSCLLFAIALTVSAYTENDSAILARVCEANIEDRHADAYSLASKAFDEMGASIDTALAVSLHNEMAIASLALHRWEDYQYHNDECVRLHRLYSQDGTLSYYCQRMEHVRSDSAVLLVFLILLSLLALFFFYLVFLKDRLRGKSQARALYSRLEEFCLLVEKYASELKSSLAGRQEQPLAIQQRYASLMEKEKETTLSSIPLHSRLKDVVDGFYTESSHRVESLGGQLVMLENLRVETDRLSFENDRLYVINQILDNALSAIKHETMYYPARVQQVVSMLRRKMEGAEAVDELFNTVSHYRHLYMLLYEQAYRELSFSSVHLCSVDVALLIQTAENKVKSYARTHGGRPAFSSKADACVQIFADAVMMSELVNRLLSPGLAGADTVTLVSSVRGDVVEIRLAFTGEAMDKDTLDACFSMLSSYTDYLVARQIVREHDELCGFPGLRLQAEPSPDGYDIVFTMKRKTAEKK